MPFAIFVLAAVNIAIGTQSFVFSGLLSELARDLGVSVGTAGLLVPASAITFAIASPFAAAWVSPMERKRVIVAGLLVLSACNVVCALAPNFETLFGLRVFGGLVTAFEGSLATASVTVLAPPHLRGRAFAIVVGGLTVALALGVPLGSVIGGAFGWRATFAYSALVCGLCALLIVFGLPRIQPTPGPRAQIMLLLRNTGIVHVFSLTVMGFAAAFTIVAFLGPIIQKLTGLTGAGVGALQVFIGLGSLLGLAAGGMAADRKLIRTGLMLAFAVIGLDALGFGWALGLPTNSVPVALVAGLILVSATAMFASIPMNLARLSQLAGPATPVALATNGSLVSLGQGLGAAWGGLISDAAELAWLGAGAAVLALLGVGLASLSPGRDVLRVAAE